MTHSIGARARRAAVAGAGAALASLVLAGGAFADQPSGGGMFVIGDQNAAVGSQVTFWGAQWWQDDSLSMGLAPAAFKGYADTATGTCGQTWTTDPGNSSDPPPTLSGEVPMIVSTQITKDGSLLSGDTAEVVLVQVDSGYLGDPGHPGTGLVVGIDCGGSGSPS